MADIIDEANDRAARDLEMCLAQVVKSIPDGTPGECELCGEWSGRLVNAACAPCRDKYKLP